MSTTVDVAPEKWSRAERLALQIAGRAHEGQFDVLGRALFVHACNVANRARTPLGELGGVVGALHDVIEQGSLTRRDLEACAFSREIVDLVELLTQRPEDSTADYLARCASDMRASVIKRIDILEKIEAASLIDDDNAHRQQQRWLQRLSDLDELVDAASSQRSGGVADV